MLIVSVKEFSKSVNFAELTINLTAYFFGYDKTMFNVRSKLTSIQLSLYLTRPKQKINEKRN